MWRQDCLRQWWVNSSVHMCRKKTWKRNLVFRITASLWKNKHPGLCEQVPFMLAGIFLNMTHVFSRMCIVPKSFGGSHKSPTTEWHPCLIPAAAVKFSRTVCFRSNMGQMCKTEGKKNPAYQWCCAAPSVFFISFKYFIYIGNMCSRQRPLPNPAGHIFHELLQIWGIIKNGKHLHARCAQPLFRFVFEGIFNILGGDFHTLVADVFHLSGKS